MYAELRRALVSVWGVLKPNLIRAGVVALSVVGVIIAALPLLILIDMARGGPGFGVCPDGIESCPRPFSAGPELVILLVVALALVVLGIRLLMKVARAEERRARRTPVAAIEAESTLPPEGQ